MRFLRGYETHQKVDLTINVAYLVVFFGCIYLMPRAAFWWWMVPLAAFWIRYNIIMVRRGQ